VRMITMNCSNSVHLYIPSSIHFMSDRMKLLRAQPIIFKPILECEVHVALLQNLAMNSVIDMMVEYILHRNILVSKVALDYNYSIVSANMSRMIERSEFPKILDPTIKVLKFSPSDDATIEKNWKSLIHGELNLKEEKAKREVFENVNEEEDIGLKSNIIGYFLSQGLPDVRLATDVFHRCRILKCFTRRSFTSEEDETILEFVKTNGRKFAQLGKLLTRSRGSVRNRYELLALTDNSKGGTSYTLEDDRIILTELFAANRNILSDGRIELRDWEKIGKMLQRNPKNVRHHFHGQVEPRLLRYHAGNLVLDMKEVLIDHMVEQNMMHAQDVDWKELVKLPKFAGCNARYLQDLHANLRMVLRKEKGMGPDQTTSLEIQKYLRSSLRREPSRKSEIYTKHIIDIYLSIL